MIDETLLAAQVMDAWAAAGLIDGDDTSRQGNEDPEWRKAKIAVAVTRRIDGTEIGTWTEQYDGQEFRGGGSDRPCVPPRATDRERGISPTPSGTHIDGHE